MRPVAPAPPPWKHPRIQVPAAVRVEDSSQGGKRVPTRACGARSSPPLRADESGRAELPEVMAHRRLSEADEPGEHARRGRVEGPQVRISEQTDAHRVGERLSRIAISRAASSSSGCAATGEQHTGAFMSMSGRAFWHAAILLPS